jgi:hypothetical protein
VWAISLEACNLSSEAAAVVTDSTVAAAAAAGALQLDFTDASQTRVVEERLQLQVASATIATLHHSQQLTLSAHQTDVICKTAANLLQCMLRVVYNHG